jgi:hypothetical protein
VMSPGWLSSTVRARLAKKPLSAVSFGWMSEKIVTMYQFLLKKTLKPSAQEQRELTLTFGRSGC